jgi:SpoVK/Ycf46/Vps4 family AAA+-type ATPase
VIETSDMLVEKGTAGYPAIYLLSSEDQRSLREIKKAAEALKRKLFFWTQGKGLLEDGAREGSYLPNTETEYGTTEILLQKEGTGRNIVHKIPPKSIVVLRGFHHHLKDPQIQATLLDTIPDYKMTARMIIVLSPVLQLPPELEKEFALMEMGLPGEEALTAVLQGIIDATPNLKGEDLPDAGRRKDLIDAAKGLTTQEAESALALSMVRPKLAKKKGRELWDPDIVLNEKCLSLRKTGILEYIPFSDRANMTNVGGMDNLKEYITPLQRAFTKDALDFGLSYPKGLLLVGPPGTGKSLGAKALSGSLRHPLLKLDMGKIYQSLVGSSEANVRMAIQVAEAVAPCILWMDEIEKGVSGASAGALDSGVSARVLGTFLTWMQEKTSPVYVYATANDVSMLPSELLRKGRFDEMFSVDLPTRKERREILEIHLRLRRRQGLVGKGDDKIDLDHFAGETTEGFTGAEIEGCIEQSMRIAFHEGHDLTAFLLQNAFDSTQPLSKIMGARIEELRRWCKARTRPANKAEVVHPVQVGTPGRNLGMA